MEVGKKENREGSRINLRLYTFLKMYNDTDIYLVTDTLDSMKGMEYYHYDAQSWQDLNFVISRHVL